MVDSQKMENGVCGSSGGGGAMEMWCRKRTLRTERTDNNRTRCSSSNGRRDRKQQEQQGNVMVVKPVAKVDVDVVVV